MWADQGGNPLAAMRGDEQAIELLVAALKDLDIQNFGVGVAGLTPNELQDPHEFNPGDPTDGCRGGLLH